MKDHVEIGHLTKFDVFRVENFRANVLKSLNGLAPAYLHDFFSERHTDYDLRDSFRKLNLPKPCTDYLKLSFGYSGALL